MPDVFSSRVRELAGLADNGDAHRISLAVLGALADHLTGSAARALADDLPEPFALPLTQTGEVGEPGGMDEFYAAVSERSGLLDAAGAVGAVLRAARRDRGCRRRRIRPRATSHRAARPARDRHPRASRLSPAGLLERGEQPPRVRELVALRARPRERPHRDLREALQERVPLEQARRVQVRAPHQRLGGLQRARVARRWRCSRPSRSSQSRRSGRGGLGREPARRAVAVDRRGRGGRHLAPLRLQLLRELRQRDAGRLDRPHARLHAALGGEPPDGLEREAAMPAGGADRLDPPLVGPPPQPAGGDRKRAGRRLQRDLRVLLGRSGGGCARRRRGEARADLQRLRRATARNASTTAGSNWRPRSARSVSTACSTGCARPVDAVGGDRVERVRHRRDPARQRDPLAGVARRDSRRRRSARGATRRSRTPCRAARCRSRPSIARPSDVWSCISRRSSGVSGPGLSRMPSVTATIPTSCSRLATRTNSGSRPSARAISAL